MKDQRDLQKDIVEISNLSLQEGMGTDELIITLLSNAVVAAKHLGLSQDFCEETFDDAIDDIYEKENEDCECCNQEIPCCKKETHQASPEMKIFFEKLLRLKEEACSRATENVHVEPSATVNSYKSGNKDAWKKVYYLLDEIIKEKK